MKLTVESGRSKKFQTETTRSYNKYNSAYDETHLACAVLIPGSESNRQKKIGLRQDSADGARWVGNKVEKILAGHVHGLETGKFIQNRQLEGVRKTRSNLAALLDFLTTEYHGARVAAAHLPNQKPIEILRLFVRLPA